MVRLPDISRMKISEKNKEYLKKFQRQMKLNGLVDRSIKSHLNRASIFLQTTTDFMDVTAEDIENYYLDITDRKSEHTVYGEMISIKVLSQYIRPDDAKDLFKNIKIKRPKKGQKKMPDWDDVKKAVQHEPSSRYKAIIMLLYDIGPRINELTKLKIEDIIFDEDSARVRIYTNDKSYYREPPIIDCVPFLQRWIEEHPFKNDPNAPLFPTTKLAGNARIYVKESLTDHRIEAKLNKLRQDCKITNPLTPHSLRKRAATRLSQYLTKAELEYVMGWKEGSVVADQYYVKVEMDVLINKRKVVAGISTEKVIEEKDRPRKCPRCGRLNQYDAVRCNYCRLVLDPQIALAEQKTQDDRIRNVILDMAKNSEFAEELTKNLKQIN